MMNRRNVLIAVSIVTLAAAMLGCGQAQAPQPADTAAQAEAPTPKPKEVELLFVQSATSASLADGVLTLGGVSGATIYFSDRPERIAGHLTTEEFVESWGVGEDSFESNPPNATLSLLSGPEPQEIVVTITNPRLEEGDLIYDAAVIEGAATATGGASSLFIDVIGRPLTPMSYAGVARRTARRVVY